MKNLDNIMLIEFSSFGGDMVAVFDETVIGEDEVYECIEEGQFYHPNIIFCSKVQWNNVFRS